MAQERMIISNTTPIINFAEIGRMDLLEKIFGKLAVPPVVVVELLAKRSLFPAAARVADSLRIVEPQNRLLVRGFHSLIHDGEAECLALSMENLGSLLILDDLQARAIATASGLAFVGTLGVLSEAKSRGLIDTVAPVIDALRNSARFWISRGLELQVLIDAGEFSAENSLF